MRLSVIVPTKDRPREVLSCIASIFEHSPQVEEVIVVDQSATPYVLPDEPRLVHLYRPELSGLTAARNAGVEVAHGELILFMDDDCLFRSDVVAETVAAFDANPDVVGVQARLADQNYNPPPLSSRVFEHGFFDVNDFGPDHDMKRTAGAGCAFRRSLFDRERFDDQGLYGYCYGEDYDFSVRARRLGRLMRVPEAIVEHCASMNNRFDRRRSFETRWKNLNYIYAKQRAQTAPSDRLWHLWWAFGETLQWLRFGFGLPRVPEPRVSGRAGSRTAA
jgi:GT2 family glycosyltransferase